MPVKLPKSTSGEPIALPDTLHCVTIIGANGSGKSRFTDATAALHEPGEVFRLSALEAIYGNGGRNEELKEAAGALFARRASSPSFLHNNPSTGFEKLTALLLNEEIANLVEFKMSLLDTAGNDVADGVVRPQPTKLDRVLRLWREIFPDNQVLRQGGRLLFTREGSDDAYSQLRLSDGEKTVLYYFGAVLYAPEGSRVFVDSPEMFLHPSVLKRVWDTVEGLRPDCRFVYTTHDLDFPGSRSRNAVIWVKGYLAATDCWDYELLPRDSGISDEIYMAIVGSRKPVLFIEGDTIHSIDAKLYPLVFRDFTIKPLGSCDKVIEATRAFNDLRGFHHLESRGIVDRDRRDDHEVEYLRGRHVFVPEVAEIENILMLEEVVKAVASYCGKSESKVFDRVKRSIISQFRNDLHQQAMQHTRHRVKRLMEYRTDGKFTNINAFEAHLHSLVRDINPRGMYEKLCREFSIAAQTGDYAEVLKVYNQKSMVPGSNVANLCGLNGSKRAYIDTILAILRSDRPQAARIRGAIIRCFGLASDGPVRDDAERDSQSGAGR
ncbi:MAG: DUF4435 domain-containing protein [Muribaculaceae bacterium]|nr:DUF4435 domain-containing protein [Muribaculaceae bacterium]